MNKQFNVIKDYAKTKLIDVKKSRLSFIDSQKRNMQQIPGIYVIKNNEHIYIGESMNPYRRFKEHKDNKKIKSDSEIILYQSLGFSKSPIYDIETELIKLSNADSEFKLKVENTKVTQESFEYFLKDGYSEVIQAIWDDFRENKWTESIYEDIINSHLYKHSPFTSPTPEQEEQIIEILKLLNLNDLNRIVVNGMPGTGKTIVLILLAIRYIEKHDDSKTVCLITQNTQLFESLKQTLSPWKHNIKILKPSKVKDQVFDFMIIDEAHRLKDRNNYIMPSSIKYLKKYNFSDDLSFLMSRCKNIVLSYDHSQELRPGDINKDNFVKKFMPTNVFELKTQMRMQDADVYLKWLHDFFNNNLYAIELKEGYQFKIYDSFSDMYNTLKQMSNTNDLVYLTSGNTRKRSESGADFEIEDIKLNWNTESKKLKSNKTWLSTENAKNILEVGYYDYVQGFDMNFSGVIIGKDLYLDEDGQLQVNPDFVVNKYDKPIKGQENYQEELLQYVINRYRVLLTRGIKGTFIYIEDDKLRNYLLHK